jgi:6,7-dimethyl-8-ribityllumazine synthase
VSAQDKERVKVLIVEARFYSELSDALLDGAKSTLDAFGATHDVISVPGALEIPGAIAMAEKWGKFDGYVALGAVIRGETYHFEIVSNESARGIMALTTDERLAIGNGILTVEDEEQAWARAKPSQGDKGGQAAKACLDMIAWKRQLKGQS